MPDVKAELEKMEKLGVISSVEEPTEWCAGMVVVPKARGKVRICVDLTKLNDSVRRERYPLPAVEQTLAQITGAWVFSMEVGRKFWLLADPLVKKILPADNIHYTIWPVQVQSTAFRHQLSF